MRWYSSLAFRIVFCSTLLILCLVGSIYYVVIHSQRAMIAYLEEKGSEINRVVASLKIEEKWDVPSANEGNWQDLGLTLDSSISDPAVQRLVIRDEHEQIKYDTKATSGLSAEKPELLPGAQTGSDGVTMLRVPILLQDKPIGTAEVSIEYTPQTLLIKALQKSFQDKFFVLVVAAFFLTVLFLCYFVLKLLKPLRTLTQVCSEVEEGRLQNIAIERNSGEILVLERKFNEMVDSLREKAEIERRLHRSERLSALGNLAAGVAHDVRNPLNSIKLITSHLRELCRSVGNAKAAQMETYTNTILDEVRRLDGIVDGFLTLAREKELQVRDYPPDKLVAEVIQLVEKEAQDRGVVVESRLELPEVQIPMDPEQLKGAILNLVMNAMDAMDGESRKAGKLSISTGHTEDGIFIKVSDTGCGISQTDMEKIFEPYYTTKRSGTGLGLTVTQKIVEAHGGEISVASIPNQGTTMRISLPRTTATKTRRV